MSRDYGKANPYHLKMRINSKYHLLLIPLGNHYLLMQDTTDQNIHMYIVLDNFYIYIRYGYSKKSQDFSNTVVNDEKECVQILTFFTISLCHINNTQRKLAHIKSVNSSCAAGCSDTQRLYSANRDRVSCNVNTVEGRQGPATSLVADDLDAVYDNCEKCVCFVFKQRIRTENYTIIISFRLNISI